MMLTPEEADDKWCPFARTFARKEAHAGCIGPSCMLWRWEQITVAHPLWKDAVKAKGAELGEKVPYPQASKWVHENLAELGLVPTRGFCGAGGQS